MMNNSQLPELIKRQPELMEQFVFKQCSHVGLATGPKHNVQKAKK